MVDLVVPVTAPGATAADAQIKSVANAAGALASQNVRLQAATQRVGAAMRLKAQSTRLAEGGFSSLSKTGLKLTGTLAQLGGLAGGVGGALGRIGGLAGAFGPLGIAIGGISFLMGKLSENSTEAEDKLKRVADIKEKLAGAQKERRGVVEELGNIAASGSGIEGFRDAIASGVDRTVAEKTVTPNINAEQAVAIEKALLNASLKDDQRQEFRRGANLVGRVGGDPVKTVQNLIQQAADDSARGKSSGVLGGSVGLSTKLDRLLDAAGLDPSTKEAQAVGQRFFDPNLSALDFGRQPIADAERAKLRDPFSTAAQSAAAELHDNFKSPAELLKKSLDELNKTISGLKDKANQEEKKQPRNGWFWTGYFGQDP